MPGQASGLGTASVNEHERGCSLPGVCHHQPSPGAKRCAHDSRGGGGGRILKVEEVAAGRSQTEEPRRSGQVQHVWGIGEVYALSQGTVTYWGLVLR